MNDGGAGEGCGLGPGDIARLIEILRESGWSEAHVRIGDFELRLSQSDGGTAPGGAASPAPVAAGAEAAAVDPPHSRPGEASPERSDVTGGPSEAGSAASTGAVLPDPSAHVVRAESLGVFWRSPQPGAPPFVEVGDEVEEDTPLAIVEVMKMMTRVVPGCRGRIVAIHVDNGELVEYGQPLLSIAAD